ncbi:stage II sporulation protein M [Aminipila sp.]|uniref:stage II sporulation protein M n=1 Tax=Aminipila sp. TaxID=2060095 RepID=UPI0028A2A71B|nr:stage II sporulation protein M [Aminipila sp.]
MRKNAFSSTIETLSISKECTAILLFIFIFGISTGVFFEVMMNTDIKSDMQTYLQALLRSPIDTANGSGNSFAALLGSIVANSFAIAFITLSGFTRFSYPASCTVLLVKGLSLGYCCALILETLGLKGIFVIILSLFPQNTLLIPTIFISANVAIAKASSQKYKKNKGIARSFNSSDVPYLYANGFLCVIVVVSCILQSIFLPIAAKLL